MKRETLRHPKMFDLAARLESDRPSVLGFLTLLWDFTAEAATPGDIGKWTDGAIARACDWNGDPGVFVAALVQSGWLDEDPNHRLIVHDWPDHCERWVKAKLNRQGQWFLERYNHKKPSTPSTEATTDDTTEATTEPSAPCDQTKPNQTKPNLSGPDRMRADPDREFLNLCEKIPELSRASEVLVDPLPANRLMQGAFPVLEEVHLCRVRSMVEWHRRQLSSPKPVVGETEAHQILVIAAGLCAVRTPEHKIRKTRVAFFVNTVQRANWSRVLPWISEAAIALEEHKQFLSKGSQNVPKTIETPA